MSIKARFICGHIDWKNMLNSGWLASWQKTAREAAEQGFDVVVFRVPKTRFGNENWEAIELIEAQLQETYRDVTNNSTIMEPIKDVVGPDAGKTLTFGEKAAGVSFNPSGDPVVTSLKQKYAAIIDELNDERAKATGEKARYYSKAISQAEDSQMNAVKAATWQH